MTPEFQLAESRYGNTVVLAATGELDTESAPALRERIVGLLEAGERRVVVDLENVAFLDSSALSALVTGRNLAAHSDATIELVCTRPGTLKVFSITQLDSVFTIHPSIQAAVDAG